MASTLPTRMRVPALCLGLLQWGCGPGAVGTPAAELEPDEWLPGGATTNTILLGSNAFLRGAANLTPEHEMDFFAGNSFFNQGWVEAPASTGARDGLGPLFNARSCSGCHFRDGKGGLPEDGEAPFVGLLLRLSVPGDGGPVPDPVYGGQLQDQALPGVMAEASPRITWVEMPGRYADGTEYALLSPSYEILQPAYGPLPGDLMVSPRIAPHMPGLGLLEAIAEARLLELSDPDDADGDGISGRVQWHEVDGERLPGRFGWKADAPTVAHQVAGALAGDMGLTSPLGPADHCTEAQADCLAKPAGGAPEVQPHIFEQLVLYSRAVAIPARRMADDPRVLQGKALFASLACDRCHVPSHETGDAALPEFEGQRIWPYTDLLLHDMGEGLADGRPVGEASGQEWKTAPLWGLGMIGQVGGAARFLHDGRARSLGEAVLWHGGEAEAAREAFVELDADDRDALLAFIEDL